MSAWLPCLICSRKLQIHPARREEVGGQNLGNNLQARGSNVLQAKESNAVGDGQMCPSHPHKVDSDVTGFTSASCLEAQRDSLELLM